MTGPLVCPVETLAELLCRRTLPKNNAEDRRRSEKMNIVSIVHLQGVGPELSSNAGEVESVLNQFRRLECVSLKSDFWSGILESTRIELTSGLAGCRTNYRTAPKRLKFQTLLNLAKFVKFSRAKQFGEHPNIQAGRTWGTWRSQLGSFKELLLTYWRASKNLQQFRSD